MVYIYIHIQKVSSAFNTLRPRQNGRHFTDDTFRRIFLNETFRISIEISLKFVPMGPINNITALVQIMAWRRSGDKPLSEPMMVRLLTHICITRPQWVNQFAFIVATLIDEWVSLGSLGTNFSEIWIKSFQLSIKNLHLKMPFAKWGSFGSDFKVININCQIRKEIDLTLKLCSHMCWAVAERRRADFDIPAHMYAEWRQADLPFLEDKDGLERAVSKWTRKIGCWTHLLRSRFCSRSASTPRMCERIWWFVLKPIIRQLPLK